MTGKTVRDRYREAERQVFPPIPDEKVFCAIRGVLVGATDCATDACVAPEQRPVCWEGRVSLPVKEQG